MRVALPNVKEINEGNMLNALKQVILALEQESDLYGHHDTKLTEEVRELRHEMRSGFEKLGGEQEETNKSIQTLTSDVDKGFDRLSKEMHEGFEQLDKRMDNQEKRMESQDEKFAEMVGLLKMIAENTKK